MSLPIGPQRHLEEIYILKELVKACAESGSLRKKIARNPLLLRASMKREYVQWLSGDAIKEAVDIYFPVDPKDVQEAYLASIPRLGI
jgi:hypothetical protein